MSRIWQPCHGHRLRLCPLVLTCPRPHVLLAPASPSSQPRSLGPARSGCLGLCPTRALLDAPPSPERMEFECHNAVRAQRPLSSNPGSSTSRLHNLDKTFLPLSVSIFSRLRWQLCWYLPWWIVRVATTLHSSLSMPHGHIALQLLATL